MKEKYEILTQFAKDLSYETPDIETYIKTKEDLSKYKLYLDINSRPLKNDIIEMFF